ncbi:MAG TPA: response regulator [Polyangiaceae bacterium]|nr:response regulator [Polyangiaceae bacterium]
MDRAVTRKRTRTRWIAVADDDDAMRTLLVASIASLGVEVRGVKDGSELVEVVCRSDATPSLVVTDLQMPNLSGMSAIRRIRKAGVEVPIVLVTAFGSDSLHADARRVGATAVLDKPFPVATLQGLVRELLAIPDVAAAEEEREVG